ncbi:MAG: helix-turn-helix transcriptional regulator [Sinobacteraceae bacterium]|nr:helix-turn-helix transcriptional regulator [Nevskiaceae bacterium]
MSASATLTSATLLFQHPQARERARRIRGPLQPWQASKLREYIDAHISDPIVVADLCTLVGLGEWRFTRSFKRTFGMPPHAFVVRRRLELATQHMLQTDAPLSDIALQCGFTDQAHFGNRFREATGLTPAAWRRSYWTRDSRPPTADAASALWR